jgi:hypothetical protein
MKKNLLLKITAIIALFIFGVSSLYYFVYRPYTKDKLREKCAQTIMSQNGGANSDDIQNGINFCVNTNFLNWKKQSNCSFEIIDLKENRYQEDEEKSVGEFWAENIIFQHEIIHTGKLKDC